MKTLGLVLLALLLAVIAYDAATDIADRSTLHGLRDKHLARGEKALAAGNLDQAQAAFRHARDISPSDPVVARALMRARAHVLAEDASNVSSENVADLRYELDLLAESDPERLEIYDTAMGNLEAQSGNRAAAKARFEAALARTPGSVRAKVAYAAFLLDDPTTLPAARKQLESVLASDQSHAGALLGMGQVEIAGGKVDEAIQYFEKSIESRDSFLARMLVGKAYYQKNDFEKSAQAFQRAVGFRPQDPSALYNLGEALLGANKPADAERVLKAAVRLREDEAAATALGFALSRQEKHREAFDIFAKLVTAGSEAPLALYGGAASAEKLGRTNDALALYQKLASLPVPAGGEASLGQLQKTARQRIDALAAAQAQPAKKPK